MEKSVLAYFIGEKGRNYLKISIVYGFNRQGY